MEIKQEGIKNLTKKMQTPYLKLLNTLGQQIISEVDKELKLNNTEHASKIMRGFKYRMKNHNITCRLSIVYHDTIKELMLHVNDSFA